MDVIAGFDTSAYAVYLALVALFVLLFAADMIRAAGDD